MRFFVDNYRFRFALDREEANGTSFLSARLLVHVPDCGDVEVDVTPFLLECMHERVQYNAALDDHGQKIYPLPCAERRFFAFSKKLVHEIIDHLFDEEDIRKVRVFTDLHSSKFFFAFGTPLLARFVTSIEQRKERFSWDILRSEEVEKMCFLSLPLRLEGVLDMASTGGCTLHPHFFLGTHELSFSQVKEITEAYHPFIELSSHEYIEVNNAQHFAIVVRLLEKFQREGDLFTGPLWHVPELLYLAYLTSSVLTYSPQFTSFLEEAQSGKGRAEVEFPPALSAIMRPYQKEGVEWAHFLRRYGFGGILADDMGLGKTLQTLALLLSIPSDRPSLIVMPKTLLYNWEQEVQKFFPSLKILSIKGTSGERASLLTDAHLKTYDLIFTSYTALLRDIESYEALKEPFHYVVLDEAQHIKNYRTKVATSVKRINAEYRLGLSGTPLENGVAELWSIFDFLMPGFLGDAQEFRAQYELPIMRYSDVHTLKLLSAKIKPFMLRRSKEVVLSELPPKIEQTLYCELTEVQQKMYEDTLASLKKHVWEEVQTKGFARSQITILAALMKLRQICNHSGMLPSDIAREEEASGKFDVFFSLLSDTLRDGRKVLVFSSFVKTLKLLEAELQKRGISYSYMDGQTKQRSTVINEFTDDPNKQVFLLSMKVGGVGLNLTASDMVVLFDPWWNPMVEMQAMDRAHRIGQLKTVHVYSLITKNTLEERMLSLKEKKKALFKSTVGDAETFVRSLTWEDIEDLFRFETPAS